MIVVSLARRYPSSDFHEHQKTGPANINREVAPICDGVINPKIYAEAKPRIAWVLKELYDDFDEQGNPRAGCWSISEIYHNTENVYDNIKGKKPLFMAYALNLFYHSLLNL